MSASNLVVVIQSVAKRYDRSQRIYDESSNVIDATCALRSRGILRLRKQESGLHEERSC